MLAYAVCRGVPLEEAVIQLVRAHYPFIYWRPRDRKRLVVQLMDALFEVPLRLPGSPQED